MRSFLQFLLCFRVYQPDLLRQFKFTVLAFYDGEKPEANPFQDFLAIPHHGELANSSYTTMDTAETLLYEHMPADNATTFLSKQYKSASRFLSGEGGFQVMSFPTPEKDVAGTSVMSARCVSTIIWYKATFPLTCC